MNFKKALTIILCASLLLSALSLFSCSGEAEYTVNVKDANGKPYTSGIIVNFMQNGEKAAMQACDDKGVAKKTLVKGNYDIELAFTGGNEGFHYDKEAYKLSAKEREIDVIVAVVPTEEPTKLSVGDKEFDAYSVDAGCTYVSLKGGERNYFLFTPTKGGNYEFSVKDAKAEDAAIGYYGGHHFVQEFCTVEVKDNAFTISIRNDMIGSGDSGTNIYVLGIDASENIKNCVLSINRLGDPIKTIEDEPWTVYEATHEPKAYTLPAGATIKEFDLTAPTDKYDLVLNEKDGFYHLDSKDGPLVLVRLAEDCDYIACFKTMLDRSAVVKYFYNGEHTYENFVKKESYSECLQKYIPCADENEGVYPLTEDLKYIIQQRGDYTGWWDIDSNGYIFKDASGNNDPTINAEIAWLLMCCYIG